ncbi:MAG: reactive intermediate/imine deaminase [Planctomycetales bacterium 71-10]|nr:MAG: reactive intermediate/imine deaminase [Planctomycetales bacterium 71-10]
MSRDDILPIRGPGVIASPLPFSPGVRAGGFVFVSGMASADEDGKLVPDTFENEARRTYENLGRVLAAAGLDFSRVVQVRCYLSSKNDWDAHNRIYREYFSEPFPARTTLIGCLGDLVKYEVDAIAYAGASEEP